MVENFITDQILTKDKFKSQRDYKKYLDTLKELEIIRNILKFEANERTLTNLWNIYNKALNVETSREAKHYKLNPSKKNIHKRILALHSLEGYALTQELSYLRNNSNSLKKVITQLVKKNEQKIERKIKFKADIQIAQNIPSEFLKTRISNKETWRLLCKNSKIKNGTYNCTWHNIQFGEGYISVKIAENILNVPEKLCKKSYNFLKDRYIKTSTPNITINVIDGIGGILNPEVLIYHIEFFKITLDFDFKNENTSLVLMQNRGISKDEFEHILPIYFRNKCFKYLCAICSSNQKIIPIGERIVGINGSEEIIESFLFPYKNRKQKYLIWESTFESRATYIFENDWNDYLALNRLCSFISGEIKNKREKLRNSPTLKNNLHLVKIIQHDDFNAWKKAIDKI